MDTQITTQGANPPAGSSYTATDGTPLNPTAVLLAKSIRQVESNGDYKAVGDNGDSHGAYQFNKGNYQAWAKQYNIDPNDMSPINQDKVAYARINDLLQKGHAPSEVAALWNGARMVNGKAVAINPAYPEKVKQAYVSQLQGQPQMAPSQPTPEQGNGEDLNHDKNFVENVTSGNLLGAGKQALDFLFPIIGDVGDDIMGKSKKNFLQQGADLGLSALPFIPGLGEIGMGIKGAGAAAEVGSKVLPGLLKTAGIGAGAGVLGSISQSGTLDPGKMAQGAALGGVTGGVLGGAGALFSKVADVLPQRIARSFIKGPGVSEDTIKYAVQKGLGSPIKMLSESDASISDLGNQLGAAIKQKMNTGYGANKGYITTLDDILPNIEKQFPNAGLDAETLGQKLMQVAPNQKTLIDKLTSGKGLNLDELHKLNSDVGKNTFKSVFDNVVAKEGKAITSSFYSSASNIIKKTVPKSVKLFDQLSKEYPLNGALQKLIRSGQRGRVITLRDIISVLGGLSFAGPMGAASAYGLEKAATNPTVNLKAAGLIGKLAGAASPGIINRGTAITGGLIGRSQ